MTLDQRIEYYLEWKATYTGRAFIAYRPWLLKFAQFVDGKAIEHIELKDVMAFRRWLDEKYQPYTIQLAIVCLHNFFKFWNTQKVECLSPSLIRVPRVRPKTRPVILLEDYEKILAHFVGHTEFIYLRNLLIVRLLWDTGIRVSELCDMNIDELDFDKRETVVRTRKSNRMRQIFWTPETQAILRLYVERRAMLSTSTALLISVLAGGTTQRIRVRSIQRMIELLGKKLKLGKNISPHSFRHGKAHRILHLGGNPKHVQAILGHSDTNPYAAFQYLEFDNKELEETARRFLREE